jgi:hypothetical protein
MKDTLAWLKSLSDGQWCMVLGGCMVAYTMYAGLMNMYFYTGLGLFLLGFAARVYKHYKDGQK